MNTFVHEYQKKSRDKLEYEKQISILDAMNHHIMHTFFTFKPNKSHVGLNTIPFYFSFVMFYTNSHKLFYLRSLLQAICGEQYRTKFSSKKN